MVDDDTRVGLDGVKVCFDDERLVSDAGVALAATLAGRLGVEELIGETVRLGVAGAASRAGRKVMALIYAMLLGADSIDDCDVLRAGRVGRLLGGLDAGAVDAGDVLAGVHVRPRPPARQGARGVPDARVARRRGPGREAAHGRRRFLCR